MQELDSAKYGSVTKDIEDLILLRKQMLMPSFRRFPLLGGDLMETNPVKNEVVATNPMRDIVMHDAGSVHDTNAPNIVVTVESDDDEPTTGRPFQLYRDVVLNKPEGKFSMKQYKVDIQDLQIRYRPDAPLVLREVTCTFQGGHKIDIVGRTGSRKTTLIGALFRLMEPAGGKIVVDGIDISTIGLHDLRSRFGVIPQDPTVFNGTVRYNLDPLCQHTDQKIWEVLGKCQLSEVVQDKTGGLDSIVVENGTNWSMGQRQLFCLGHALLRQSKILVLDEATTSVDNATNTMLQETIISEFADCTVITVAHRIPTVMGCTMVLTMSYRKITEYDEPMKLMKRDDSLFGLLVKEYWSHSQSTEI